MGSTDSEQAWALAEAKKANDPGVLEWISGEGPRHRVRITTPFWLGMHEVTQGEFERVIGRNPSVFSAAGTEQDKVARQDTSDFPVEMVSWDEATEFCLRMAGLNAERTAGRVYCLPTEAQWEYGCRAGTATRWYSGDDEGALNEHAWTIANHDGKTHPRGQKSPNAWGLHDMHGNVWEWCQDWWAADFYKPTLLEDPLGAPRGSSRVYRGGGWGDRAANCRSADRHNVGPLHRGPSLGLRVCLVQTDGSPFRAEGGIAESEEGGSESPPSQQHAKPAVPLTP
jgi:formylglycine-generating enzyme required for sulfatase activity